VNNVSSINDEIKQVKVNKPPFTKYESTFKSTSTEIDQPATTSNNQFEHKIIPNKWRSEPDYPKKFIIGNPKEGMQTRASSGINANIALIFQLKSKKVNEVLEDDSWVKAMK